MAVDLSLVAYQASILGSDGVLIGTVDHVEGDRIGLKEVGASEISASEQRFIAGKMVGSIENGLVWLNVNAAQAVAFDASSTTYED